VQGDLGSLLGNLWILIFILLFLIPQFQRLSLAAARRRMLTKISKSRRSNVITLIHRQETIAFLNIPIARYIDIDDSEQVLRAIRMVPKDEPIDLIIHTPGGLAIAAAQIAMALKDHTGKKTVIVPHYAMSGGTLIALAADSICMDSHAFLGPVDPQIGDQNGSYPASSLIHLTKVKNVNEIDDRTLILAEEAKKAVRQMQDLVRKILGDRFPEEKVGQIVGELVSGKYTHDHPITRDDIERLLGSQCIEKKMPQEVYDLMALYRMESGPRRPGVEFVPVMPDHRKK